MNPIVDKLEELLHDLETITPFDKQELIDSKNKLNLYVARFFNNNQNYLTLINSINTNVQVDYEFNSALSNLKSLTKTLLEDAKLSDIDLISDEQKTKIINEYKKYNDEEKNKLALEIAQLTALQNQLKKERQDLLNQQAKFDEFKSKLELADKSLDFQSEAIANKRNAQIWAYILAGLIILLIIFLFVSLDSTNSFANIANETKKKMGITTSIDGLTTSTIYFAYGKYIFTKVLLYSMCIYGIIFCIKNYNAQMHNQVINIHKANAFKSTVSLLNTAKSDDGNDKLLIQATQAIFSHQQTGYYGRDAEPQNPNLVTNVIETAAKKL